MAYVAVDKDGTEIIFSIEPERGQESFYVELMIDNTIDLPKGSIEKLIGKKLTWEDEPVELLEVGND